MKDPAVKMMALAMVAQIEAQNVESAGEQFGTDRDHVTRIRAAFPTVQHDRNARAERLLRRLLNAGRQKSQQPRSVAAIE